MDGFPGWAGGKPSPGPLAPCSCCGYKEAMAPLRPSTAESGWWPLGCAAGGPCCLCSLCSGLPGKYSLELRGAGDNAVVHVLFIRLPCSANMQAPERPQPSRKVPEIHSAVMSQTLRDPGQLRTPPLRAGQGAVPLGPSPRTRLLWVCPRAHLGPRPSRSFLSKGHLRGECAGWVGDCHDLSKAFRVPSQAHPAWGPQSPELQKAVPM